MKKLNSLHEILMSVECFNLRLVISSLRASLMSLSDMMKAALSKILHTQWPLVASLVSDLNIKLHRFLIYITQRNTSRRETRAVVQQQWCCWSDDVKKQTPLHLHLNTYCMSRLKKKQLHSEHTFFTMIQEPRISFGVGYISHHCRWQNNTLQDTVM